MNKKVVALLLVVILIVSAFAGCGQKNDGDTTQNTAKKEEPKVLRIAHCMETDSEFNAYQVLYGEIMEQFTADTGIEIEYEFVAFDKLESKLVLTNQSGEPAADLFGISSQKLASLVNQGALMPLDDFIDDEMRNAIAPVAWDLGTYPGDNKTYAVLQSITSRGLHYNTELVPEAPKTWEEMAEAAQKVTDFDNKIFGTLVWVSPEYAALEGLFSTMVWEYGGVLCDEEGRAAWNNEAVKKATQFMADLVYEYEVAPKSGLTDSAGEMVGGLIDKMANGNVAVVGSFCGFDNIFRSSELGQRGGIAFAPFPSVEEGGEVYNFVNGFAHAIPSNSKNADLAFEFIEYFTMNEDFQDEYCELESTVPVLLSVTERERFSQEPTKTFVTNCLEYGRSMDPFVYYQEGLGELALAVSTYVLDPENSDLDKLLEDSEKAFNQKYYGD